MKGKGSRIFRSSNWARKNQDKRREEKMKGVLDWLALQGVQGILL